MSPSVAPPDIRSIAAPVLSALPGAAASIQPATTVLPLLSPILRQRVQLLSSVSTESWIRLLTYDTANVPQLTSIAQSGSLEPHPVSGEIELDWDHGVDIRYRRLDQETLQTLVVLVELGLFLRLVYCTGDADGGGDGWRVGEVGVASGASTLSSFGGFSSISDAEKAYETTKLVGGKHPSVNGTRGPSTTNGTWTAQPADDEEDNDDDDDDYWARYDATPARTPAVNRSPAPQQQTAKPSQPDIARSRSAEDAYYAQYDSVQPAMDNYDPDEDIEKVEHVEHNERVEHVEHVDAPPPLGLARVQRSRDSTDQAELSETGGTWTLAEPPKSPSAHSSRSREDEERTQNLLHPRPASSASSSGSQMVAKLEERAEKREQSEFGVKQHISRSIRSLFLLSRASGIDREEFERMVRTELDVLGIVEDDI
ncbi:hypothetical protein MMYC01_206430 [Madurella mycetomatis]|uniref:Uncharacterized protein n=1 Tax=Madurella mycetomatis TaxID=100816 RepID=A0A175W1G8_9PEZI|nr:hypothetical protein MMYC01_207386 [Madurella mycetomatis]KXX77482.1 hypothetical protein MMYC01_206430 [Madurella mycetomatis]